MKDNFAELAEPGKREQRSLEHLAHVKSLVERLLSSEFPSVRLLRYPPAAYWGAWEFNDQAYAELPNSNILVKFEPTSILSDDQKQDFFRRRITGAREAMSATAGPRRVS
jgi:hypothetical protein